MCDCLCAPCATRDHEARWDGINIAWVCGGLSFSVKSVASLQIVMLTNLSIADTTTTTTTTMTTAVLCTQTQCLDGLQCAVTFAPFSIRGGGV